MKKSALDVLYELILQNSGLSPIEQIQDILESSAPKKNKKKVAPKSKKSKKKSASKSKKSKKTIHASGYVVSDLYDEPIDDEAIDLSNKFSSNTREYFADLFDSLDINPTAEEDVYHITLKKVINKLARQYKKINNKRFLFNTKRDLTKTYQSITIHALIHSESSGYSIFSYAQTRGNKSKLSVNQWASKFTRETKANGVSMYETLTQNILPAINARGSDDWRFLSVVAWNGNNGISKTKNSNTHKRGNNKSKKRVTNASNTNRNRHRNKKR